MIGHQNPLKFFEEMSVLPLFRLDKTENLCHTYSISKDQELGKIMNQETRIEIWQTLSDLASAPVEIAAAQSALENLEKVLENRL